MQVDVVVIESDDVENAIAGEVAKSGIRKLVIGAPSRGMFTRYFFCVMLLHQGIKDCQPFGDGFVLLFVVSEYMANKFQNLVIIIHVIESS